MSVFAIAARSSVRRNCAMTAATAARCAAVEPAAPPTGSPEKASGVFSKASRSTRKPAAFLTHASTIPAKNGELTAPIPEYMPTQARPQRSQRRCFAGKPFAA